MNGKPSRPGSRSGRCCSTPFWRICTGRSGCCARICCRANWCFRIRLFCVRAGESCRRAACILHMYSADLARSPDGQWWVLADRTQAPSGAGYALENRLVSTRVMPEVFRASHVRRVANFFQAYRNALQRMVPVRRENPRIVVLTPGPYNETYFEHAFLARYLGYTLVEGGDLTVRENHVYSEDAGRAAAGGRDRAAAGRSFLRSAGTAWPIRCWACRGWCRRCAREPCRWRMRWDRGWRNRRLTRRFCRACARNCWAKN